jgi:hypothetical protein
MSEAQVSVFDVYVVVGRSSQSFDFVQPLDDRFGHA